MSLPSGQLTTGLAATTLAAVLMTSVAGCELFRSAATPEVPLWKRLPSGALRVVRRRSLVARSREAGEPYEKGHPAIDRAHRRLFIGSSDHGLYALDASSLDVIWRFETLGPVQSAPLYDPQEDVVYFGSNDGALYKVRARDGKLLYRFMTNAEVARLPVLDDGRLFVVNGNDTVLALDSETGKKLWAQHRTPAQGMEVASHAGPLVWRDKVYVGFSDGTVTAFDAVTGNERWSPVDLSAEAEQALGELPQYLDADTTPVPDVIEAGPVVYVGSYQGGVFALDAETGTRIWSNPAVRGVHALTLWKQPPHESRKGSPLPARKLLIAASGTTGLWGIEPEDGSEHWRQDVPDGGLSMPIPAQGALLASASRLGVFLFSPIDGGVIDGIHTGEGISMTPAVEGGRAYVMTNGGFLLSLSIGAPLPPRPPTDTQALVF